MMDMCDNCKWYETYKDDRRKGLCTVKIPFHISSHSRDCVVTKSTVCGLHKRDIEEGKVRIKL